MKKVMFLLGVMVMFLMSSCIKGPNVGGYSSRTFRGKLEVTPIGGSEPTYKDNNALMTITIPNSLEPKLDVVFLGVKFSEQMRNGIDLEFKAIPFDTTISEDGSQNTVFDVKDVIPTGYDSQMLINQVWGCLGSTVDVRFEMQSRGSQVRFYTEADSTENE